MVLEEDGIPAIVCRIGLAFSEDALQVGEHALGGATPYLSGTHGNVRVTELEEHVEHALLADPLP